MKYVVEENFDNKFVEELKNRGLRHEINDGKRFADICGDNVIIRGNCKTRYSYPGYFYDHYLFDYKNFAPYFGDDLLNSEYFLLPLGDLLRRRKNIHEHLGHFFIRPNSGNKMFDGQIIYDDKNIPVQIQAVLDEDNNNDELVVIAKHQTIIDEYRLVIHKHKYVAGSKYKFGDIHSLMDADYCIKEIITFGEKMSKKYFIHDSIYIMDIARYIKGYDIKLGVIELNCFGKSDLYNSDRGKIIDVLEIMED